MPENQTIGQYVLSRRQAGATDDTIQSELLASGWDRNTISTAINQSTRQNISQTSESHKPSNGNKKTLLPQLIIAVILIVVAGFAWYLFQNNQITSMPESNQVIPSPSVTASPESLAEPEENSESSQSLTREQSVDKAPYVAAASDVEQIINAVSRYHAFQGRYPATLQDMVDKKELTQSFIDRKQAAYTLTFSATSADDFKVFATFADGTVITSLCNDAKFH
ncbi:MAG: hypothetical protein QG593_740, partial [Patescibacteria group bacterium]|nr:hypothetical protein [Patescibacteria group bacterium]